MKEQPILKQTDQRDWSNTDEMIDDLLTEITPDEIFAEKEIPKEMIRDLRDFMIGQFESRGIATIDQIHSYMELLDGEDDDDDSFNINIE